MSLPPRSSRTPLASAPFAKAWTWLRPRASERSSPARSSRVPVSWLGPATWGMEGVAAAVVQQDALASHGRPLGHILGEAAVHAVQAVRPRRRDDAVVVVALAEGGQDPRAGSPCGALRQADGLGDGP